MRNDFYHRTVNEAQKRLGIFINTLPEGIWLHDENIDRRRCKYGDPDKFMIEAMASRELKKVVRRALSTLTPREEIVLRMRFGIGYRGRTHTLDEVGAAFDVTRERIRQIESKALRKLRHPCRTKFLREYVEGWELRDSVVAVETAEDGTVDMPQVDTKEAIEAAAKAKAEEKARKTRGMYKEGLRNLSLDANSLDYRMYWYTKDNKIDLHVRRALHNNLISRINDFSAFENRCIEIKAESEKLA